MFSYEKIHLITGSTTPPTNRRPKTPPRKAVEGGGGGHASEPEKTSTTRKEPENDPDTIPFMSKRVHMQRKNTTPGHTDNPEPSGQNRRLKGPKGKDDRPIRLRKKR